MHYLYGSKKDAPNRLVATFGSEQQLLAYVCWATPQDLGDHRGKFEQGSALASYDAWEHAVDRQSQPLQHPFAQRPVVVCAAIADRVKTPAYVRQKKKEVPDLENLLSWVGNVARLADLNEVGHGTHPRADVRAP